MDEQFLEEIGLTKGEARVYLTLLRTGETTTGRIITEARISGGKVYFILDRLMKKGLVNFMIREKTRYFTAATPRKISEYLDDLELALQSKRKKFQERLPSLLALETSAKEEYETRLYLGYGGIKTAIFNALENISAKDDVLVMGIDLSREEKYNLLWKNWHAKRVKKGIRCRMLFSDEDRLFFPLFSKMKKTQVRLLKGITPASVGMVGNQVLITTYGAEPSSLFIRHPQIVSSFRAFFYSLWDSASTAR